MTSNLQTLHSFIYYKQYENHKIYFLENMRIEIEYEIVNALMYVCIYIYMNSCKI